MTDASESLKQLVKDPLFYVIAVFVGTGGYIIKGSVVSPSWFVGVGMVIFGEILLVVQIIAAQVDLSFKRRYNDLVNAQAQTIKRQNNVITALSKNAIDVHGTMTKNTDQLANGYLRQPPAPTPSTTRTSTT